MSEASYTPPQLEQLALAHLRQQLVSCPNCSSRMPSPKRLPRGSGPGPDTLFFMCEHCGMKGQFHGVMGFPAWTPAEVSQMADDEARHGEARCPHDQCLVRIVTARSDIPWRAYICPFCGSQWSGNTTSLP
jgi:DNA-directed RNA polymerase subunit M/transcription elongation factor TFIIS